MRYSAEHKARTRARILREAAAALRRKGSDGVVVAEVMAGAGLTQGGFYVHFKSKDDLIEGAIAEAFSEVSARFDEIVEGRPPAAALAAYIDAYLSNQHSEQRDQGCPIAALGGEAGRLTDGGRQAFEDGVDAIVARLAGWLRAEAKPDPEGLAASALAEMVGALVLSRGVADSREGRRMLRNSRDSLRTRLGLAA